MVTSRDVAPVVPVVGEVHSGIDVSSSSELGSVGEVDSDSANVRGTDLQEGPGISGEPDGSGHIDILGDRDGSHDGEAHYCGGSGIVFHSGGQTCVDVPGLGSSPVIDCIDSRLDGLVCGNLSGNGDFGTGHGHTVCKGHCSRNSQLAGNGNREILVDVERASDTDIVSTELDGSCGSFLAILIEGGVSRDIEIVVVYSLPILGHSVDDLCDDDVFERDSDPRSSELYRIVVGCCGVGDLQIGIGDCQ